MFLIPNRGKCIVHYLVVANIFIIFTKVWRALEEGKMSAIADGVSRSYKETSEEERRRIRENIIKYIMSQSRTSGHKVQLYLFDQKADRLFCRSMPSVIFSVCSSTLSTASSVSYFSMYSSQESFSRLEGNFYH